MVGTEGYAPQPASNRHMGPPLAFRPALTVRLDLDPQSEMLPLRRCGALANQQASHMICQMLDLVSPKPGRLGGVEVDDGY